ncbi:MAG: F0F1 ATP synthase subunit alpha, partial [Chloroflexi bacterium]|nr:F0F1 ATP synthase subunit alpha [Chloroflexota bacterium]
KVKDYELNFHRFMEANYSEISKTITKDGKLSEKTEEALKKAIEDFNKGYQPITS